MRKIRDFFGITSLFIWMLSFSILFVLLCTPLYKWSIGQLGVPQQTGFSQETLLHNYNVLLSYLTIPWIQTLSLPNFPSSPNGLFHFYEVKRLFLLNNGLFLLSTVTSILFVWRLKKEQRIWTLVTPFRYSTIVPLVLLAGIAVNFNSLFVLFHKLAFNNDLWLFNASTDPIINALPQAFFMYCFILVFVLFETFAIGGLWASKRYAYSFSAQKKPTPKK